MTSDNFLVLNQEQQMLRDAAQEFLAANLSVDYFRRTRDEHGVVAYSDQYWQRMVNLGWASVLIPAHLDGLGFGIKGMGVLAIEQGRYLSASPLIPCAGLVVESLMSCEPSEPRDRLLRMIGEGKEVIAFANSISVTTAKFVAEGMASDGLLVLNREGASFDLYDFDDLQRSPLSLIDRRDYAHVDLSGTKPSQRFKPSKDIEQASIRVDNVGAVFTAAELFGIAEESFKQTVAYISERQQFGRKIGSFQAVQHRMAKAYMELQMLKSVLYDALDAVESARTDISRAVSHAKALANETSQLICTEAIQLHGGMGITDELDIGLYYKRARVLQSAFGGTAYHKNAFAKASHL